MAHFAAKMFIAAGIAIAFSLVLNRLKKDGRITQEEFNSYCLNPKTLWVDIRAGKFGKDVESEFVDYEEVPDELLQLPPAK